MNYKEYQASIGDSEKDEYFVGKVLRMSDIMRFQCSSVEEKPAFQEAIDTYLETNNAPQKPASGRFKLRFPPEIHARAT